MKNLIIIPFLLFSLILNQLNGQNAPIAAIGTIETFGSTTVIPITVTEFSEIGACDFRINYDPAVATAASVSLGPGVGAYLFTGNVSTPGQISVSWMYYQPGVSGLTLPDNSVFLNITFNRVSYGYSAIEFNLNHPLHCEFYDWDFEQLNDTPNSTYYFDGSVTFANENGFQLNLKVFLEGPYDTTTNVMSTNLMSGNLLPSGQPFNPTLPYYGNNTPKWLYSGTETVSSFPTATVDYVLLELRDATSAANANAGTRVAQMPALLLNDGSIVALDGSSLPTFSNSITNFLYIIIWSRNHVGIMNMNGITPSGTVNYDFTTGSGQVFGGNTGYIEIEPGVWGMASGDINADGVVDISDKSPLGWKVDAGKKGYYGADLNMNTQVNNNDKNSYWGTNNGIKSTQVPN